jgi:hypothetical protein
MRIIGDVHLAILSEEPSICVDDDSRVMVKAQGSLFEQAGNKHDL